MSARDRELADLLRDCDRNDPYGAPSIARVRPELDDGHVDLGDDENRSAGALGAVARLAGWALAAGIMLSGRKDC